MYSRNGTSPSLHPDIICQDPGDLMRSIDGFDAKDLFNDAFPLFRASALVELPGAVLKIDTLELEHG